MNLLRLVAHERGVLVRALVLGGAAARASQPLRCTCSTSGTLTNLLGLLIGFALLAQHFEDSNVPLRLPRVLPSDWRGAFLPLAIVFVLSSFLDNIPLTALALEQGGYDWSVLAYAVG